VKLRLQTAIPKLGVAALLGTAIMASGAYSASAQGTNAGTALIVDTTGKNLNAGGSQVPFLVKLPAGASCSGDTVHGFHAFGFIVDSTAVPNPGTLMFDSGGPVAGPSGQTAATGFPLASAAGGTASSINQAVALNTGQVQNPNPAGGNYDWSFFSVDGSAGFQLPTGTYWVGIACTNPVVTQGQPVSVDQFWSAQLTFSGSTTDPNMETWQTQPNPQVPEFPWALALPLSALGILCIGVFVVRRRRTEATVTS
jgi:hypothetical protein